MKKKTSQVKISPIFSLNDSETQERDFGVLKSKKGPPPPPHLEAYAFCAHLGNRSVFILGSAPGCVKAVLFLLLSNLRYGT